MGAWADFSYLTPHENYRIKAIIQPYVTIETDVRVDG